MPKLRYYKNFEEIGENSEYIEDKQRQEIRGTLFTETTEPKGWWSNENIITGLTDKQITTNIQYHKTQIRILEEVLLNRSLGISRYIPPSILHFRQDEELELENARKNVDKIRKSEVRFIMKQLLPILKNIRKKHGTDVFEFCRDGWLELLSEYYKNERSQQ